MLLHFIKGVLTFGWRQEGHPLVRVVKKTKISGETYDPWKTDVESVITTDYKIGRVCVWRSVRVHTTSTGLTDRCCWRVEIFFTDDVSRSRSAATGKRSLSTVHVFGITRRVMLSTIVFLIYFLYGIGVSTYNSTNQRVTSFITTTRCVQLGVGGCRLLV